MNRKYKKNTDCAIFATQWGKLIELKNVQDIVCIKLGTKQMGIHLFIALQKRREPLAFNKRVLEQLKINQVQYSVNMNFTAYCGERKQNKRNHRSQRRISG